MEDLVRLQIVPNVQLVNSAQFWAMILAVIVQMEKQRLAKEATFVVS